MIDNRFFVAFAPALLGVDESRFDEACALVAQGCALDQVVVRRATGLAGSGRDEDRIALFQWI